jgi:2-polyprenyl-3-methyl-5-hydroxy-6-metoxy-1,4-benzoquinol methylase
LEPLKTTRKKLPESVASLVLIQSRRRCCLCFYFHGDLDWKSSGQIAHINRNRNDNEEGNLAFLCLKHHDDYDSKRSQSKGITKLELLYAKKSLYDALDAQYNNHNRPHRPEDNAEITEVYTEFELSNSVEFYDLVAEFYDERNTQNYEKTYDLIHSLCQDHKGDLSGISICDLGGGTGALLKKFMHHNVHWTNVDLSKKALSVFEKNYAEFSTKAKRPFDIVNGSYPKPNEKFDVVIMSFVLSSLPTNFPFRNLNKIMLPSSVLIIADNHMEYSTGKPFRFKEVNGQNYALKTKPIDPFVLKTQVTKQGFHQEGEVEFIYAHEGRAYSHVQAYKLV